MKITILGQGAMGSRMADRLEAAGHAVTRWNRSGAQQTPRAAVAGAELVLAMLRDDDASRCVWLDNADGALAAMDAGAVAVESSTLTVDLVRELGQRAAARSIAFLDAPVLGSRPQAEAGQLIHLVGGELAVLDSIRPVLAAMGASQLHAGPVGAGAALKLVANALFGVQVALVAELLGRLPALGLEPALALELLGQTPVLSLAAKGASALMLAGRDDPLFPVDLVAKDFDYALQSAADAMPLTAAAADVFARAVDAGLGNRNLTVVERLYRVTGG